MSIIAYTGLPGHGKSYGVVDNVIRPALENKREIFTNIPINTDICLDNFGCCVTQFNINDVIDNPLWFTDVFKAGAILVIDEVWRLWPSGLKANNVRDCDKEFLAEHRHLVGESGKSTEVILVTQDLSQIAMFARSLVETTFHVVKLSAVGMSKKYRVDVYYGAVTGSTPPKSKRNKEIFGSFKKEIFALYKSHTKSETGQAGDETRTDNRFNVLTGYKVKLFIAAIVGFGIFAFYGLSALFDKGLVPAESETPDVKKMQMVEVKENVYTMQEVDEIRIQAEKETLEKVKQQQENELLYESDHVEISFNLGNYPDVKYLFNIIYGSQSVEIDPDTLTKMGYKVEPVNSCLVIIKNDHYQTIARCYQDIEKEDFFSELAS